MKILFATALFLAVAAAGVYSQACHLREIDLCTAIGLFHYQSNGVPADEEKVVEFCETMKEVEECMGNFSSKCLSPLQREIIGVMSGSGDGPKQLCIAGSEMRVRYLKHAVCLSEGTELDEFKGYLKDIQVMIEKLFNIEYKQRFNLMCCGFRRFHESLHSMTRRRCGEEAVELVRDLMKMVTTDIPENICLGTDPASERCQELLPAPGTPPKAGENKSQISKLLDTVLGGN